MKTNGVSNVAPRPKKSRRFGMRSMFAIVAGCGLIALAIRWLLDLGVTASDVAFLLVPWVLGSLGGIVVIRRLGRSSVIGGSLGGGCGAMLCLFIDMFRTLEWSPWPIEQLVLIFAVDMCGGGLLAGMMAIVLDGLSIPRSLGDRVE